LINHFIEKYNQLYQKEAPPLSPDTMAKMVAFNWPGNVRQLENLIKQIVVRGDESIAEDLAAGTPAYAPRNAQPASGDYYEEDPELAGSYSLKKRVGAAIAREEKRLIKEVLTNVNWNRRKAADILEISYRSLLYKIKDYNLNSTK